MKTNKVKTIQGIHYETGQLIEVTIKDGRIDSIKECSNNLSVTDIIAPGLIDIQINGYMGIDFNENSLEEIEWKNSIKYLSKIGVTTFYPTVITNSTEKLSRIFQENAEFLKSNPSIKQFIGGFHLEGPFISAIDGPRGAHAKEHVRPPNWEEFLDLQEKAHGMIKLLTLSPEWPNAASFIRKVSSTGVIVSIGHTAANNNQIVESVQAGTVLSTHLGNGAHATLPRHPNYIWDQLAEDKLWASVIADGHHLPRAVLKVIDKVKRNKMILVSDSVALAGMPSGDYTTPVGGEVTLTNNGKLHLRDQPNLLAGSAMNLLQGIQFLVENKLSTFSEAINKASIYPARLMGLPQGKGLSPGAPADLIVFNKNQNQLVIKETYKTGNRVSF